MMAAFADNLPSAGLQVFETAYPIKVSDAACVMR